MTDEPLVSSEEMNTLLQDPAPQDGTAPGKPHTLGLPEELSHAERRTLAGATQQFAAALQQALAARFQCEATVEPGAVAVDLCATALSSAPAGSSFQLLSTGKSRTAFVWHPEIRGALIDRLLGGAGETDDDARKVSGFETVVLYDLEEALGRALQAMRGGDHGAATRCERSTSEAAELQLGEGVAPVVLVSFRVTLASASGDAMLVASRSVLEDLGALPRNNTHTGPASIPASRLRRIPLELSAELRGITLSLQDLMALRSGDQVAFDLAQDARFTICVNRLPAFFGSLRVVEGERVIEFLEPIWNTGIEKGSRSRNDHY